MSADDPEALSRQVNALRMQLAAVERRIADLERRAPLAPEEQARRLRRAGVGLAAGFPLLLAGALGTLYLLFGRFDLGAPLAAAPYLAGMVGFILAVPLVFRWTERAGPQGRRLVVAVGGATTLVLIVWIALFFMNGPALLPPPPFEP